MKICELGSTGSSSFSKGMRNDAKKRDLIKRRQKLRNDIDDINSFMDVMAQSALSIIQRSLCDFNKPT